MSREREHAGISSRNAFYSRTRMSNWLRQSIVYEVNTAAWLRDWSRTAGRPLSLADLPEEAWDQFARMRVSAVWLMGVWERSPEGRRLALESGHLLKELRDQVGAVTVSDVMGSPYCVRRYMVDPFFGGPDALAAARRALERRGIRLLLDFVPNHLAPDHPWVSAHPDWLLRGTTAELKRQRDAFALVDGHVFARGRDPYFPPWSDVLQINVFHRDVRRAAVLELQQIAEQCDGVRCDMAMLVMNDIFAKTWAKRAGVVPEMDYWPEIIPPLRNSHPEFLFMAEAYWDRELALLEQGFDACYDKGLYDELVRGSAESIRKHLARFPAIQDQLVRFLENHDEPRAASMFPGAKGMAAAAIWMTLPGIRLLHDGQLEGRKLKTPIHLASRPEERIDATVENRLLRLASVLSTTPFQTGKWMLCDVIGWTDNSTARELIAWFWIEDGPKWLTVVNFGSAPAQGQVQFAGVAVAGKNWRLTDLLEGFVWKRSGQDLSDFGLHVALGAWGCHILQFEAE